jgi:Cytochrome c553
MKAVPRLLCSLALACTGIASHAAEPATSAPDPAKGAALSASVCAACHTNDGSRGDRHQPDHPGPAPDYLVKQLTDSRPASATTRS